RIYEDKSHQQVVSEKMMAESGRTKLTIPLKQCVVQYVTNAQAAKLIKKFEYLGTMPRSPLHAVGLFAPDGEFLGVEVFNKTAQTPPTKKPKALCLARGSCVPWAPKNAAPYLIDKATKMIFKDHGVEAFYAYADPDPGEKGHIYTKALGWKPLKPSSTGSNFLRKAPKNNPCGFPDEWLDDQQFRRHGKKCGHTYNQHYAMG